MAAKSEIELKQEKVAYIDNRRKYLQQFQMNYFHNRSKPPFVKWLLSSISRCTTDFDITIYGSAFIE
jgi:hypothetical protein